MIEKYLGEEVMATRKDFDDFVKAYLKENLSQYYPLFLEEPYSVQGDTLHTKKV